ncbi:MAG: hypothetical protein ACI8V2_002686 [Candidatus Latescibacterota bacterium]|jgi:hypothetical protein
MIGRILGSLFLIFFCSTAFAADRATMRVNTYMSYTDNLFQNYNRRSDWITLAYIDLNYILRPSMNLYYTGNANVFAEYRDLFSHTHQMGLSYVRPGKGRNAIYAGLATDMRLDRPIYRYYDYVQSSAYINAKRYVRPTLLALGGYQVRYRSYLNAEDYNFVEQTASVKFSRFFQTRTTLQFQGSLGLKTYAHAVNQDSTLGVVTRSRDARTLAQVITGVKVAQSLTRYTGLQVEYLRRFTLAGRNRYAALDGYNTDDELFDDQYSYEGQEYRTKLKYSASSGLSVEIMGRYVTRNYTGRPALDLNGFIVDPDLVRADTRKSLSVAGTKMFKISRGWFQKTTITAEWLLNHIASTDSYYDTSGQVLSVGLQLSR